MMSGHRRDKMMQQQQQQKQEEIKMKSNVQLC
ncbi:hypothetical protein DAI22_07g118833 [Oryza sativa Japonica Group]|nr:hypothetical protein DAI22_07g118833 [Oryza sativa Japonica Group]